MTEEIPISEVRRVMIEYEIRVPQGQARPAEPQLDETALLERLRRELIRAGSRDPNIFGGRA